MPYEPAHNTALERAYVDKSKHCKVCLPSPAPVSAFVVLLSTFLLSTSSSPAFLAIGYLPSWWLVSLNAVLCAGAVTRH